MARADPTKLLQDHIPLCLEQRRDRRPRLATAWGDSVTTVRPHRASWYCAGRISNIRVPVAPDTRHVQVVREWCPETFAGIRTCLATRPCRWSETLTELRYTSFDLNHQFEDRCARWNAMADLMCRRSPRSVRTGCRSAPTCCTFRHVRNGLAESPVPLLGG